MITLPFERPLYDARPAARVESMLDPGDDEEIDVSTLFTQTFVDQSRLADNVRNLIPRRSTALLSDVIAFYPVEQGAAEVIEYVDVDGNSRRARMPKVTVSRR